MFTADTGQQSAAAAALGLALHQLPAKGGAAQTNATAGQHFPLIYGRMLYSLILGL